MFVCLREFVSIVFELWVRGKNMKFGVGKKENMGYEKEKKNLRFRVEKRENLGCG